MFWEPFKVCTMSSVQVQNGEPTLRTIEIDENLLSLSVKSLSDTRWACRYDAIQAIDEQMERAITHLPGGKPSARLQLSAR